MYLQNTKPTNNHQSPSINNHFPAIFLKEVLDTVQPQYDEPPVGSVWQDCRKMNWEGNKMGKYIRDLILKIIITFFILLKKITGLPILRIWNYIL